MPSFWSNLPPLPVADTSESVRYYALIDAAQLERFSQTMKLKSDSILSRVALLGEQIAPDRYDASPHLLELAGPNSYRNLVGQFARLNASPGVMTCLASALAASELAARLRRRLDAILPDEVECINRFFDGRISPHLHACLDDQQRSEFFSLATQWLVVGHDYTWQSLACHFAEHDPYSGPLAISTRQEAYLIDHCYPYALIEHFERTDADLLDGVPAAQRYRFFKDAMAAAEEYGIERSSDITLFCTLSMTRGASFHEQAPWPEKLKAVQAGTASLQDVLKSIHD